MKKIIIAILAVIIVNTHVFADTAYIVGIGGDLEGIHKLSEGGRSATDDVSMGVTVLGEIISDINDSVGIGGGLKIQIPRQQMLLDGRFAFIPVYGIMRIKLSQALEYPFAKVQLGYNIFLADNVYKEGGSIAGGLYYGLGGGIVMPNGVQFEISYLVNNGSMNSWFGFDGDYNIAYSKVNFSIGYNFK